MENRLRNMKNKRLSNSLEFTEHHRANIYRQIDREREKDEDVLLAVLQLLSEEKTGFVLLKQLLRRGIQKFEDKEGSLYLLLHELEKKELIQSVWGDDSQKYYKLKQKGHKFLKKTETKDSKASSPLQELLRGELLYE